MANPEPQYCVAGEDYGSKYGPPLKVYNTRYELQEAGQVEYPRNLQPDSIGSLQVFDSQDKGPVCELGRAFQISASHVHPNHLC